VGKLERWSASTPDQVQSLTFEDIEYGRYVERPANLLAPPFPAYYDGVRKKLRVSVSLPVRRKRIQLQQPVYFHYPLKAPGALTGAVASVSAPF
jgi:hypothetical protein